MRNEWDGLRKDEYEEEWSYQIEFGGDMVIEYDNKQIYKKIPDHLMINLKLNEGRMWKRSDGMYIVQYNRDKEKQQFKYQLEEHMELRNVKYSSQCLELN